MPATGIEKHSTKSVQYKLFLHIIRSSQGGLRLGWRVETRKRVETRRRVETKKEG